LAELIFAATVNEGGVYTVTNSDLTPADVDNEVATLRYELTSVPSTITVFRDNNGDGQVDAGEALIARNGSTPGYEFTQGEVVAGKIKVRQNGEDLSIVGLTETQAELLVNSAVYANSKSTPSAGLRKVILDQTVQMDALGVAASAVTIASTNVEITTVSSDLFASVNLATPAGSDSYQSLIFKMTGVSDGANETITFNAGTVGTPILHSIPMVVGSTVLDGIIYAVTQVAASGSTPAYLVLTVSRPFAGLGLELKDNGENNVVPVKAALNITVTPVNDVPALAATAVGGQFVGY
jgi:hypothetical protein